MPFFLSLQPIAYLYRHYGIETVSHAKVFFTRPAKAS